MGKFTRFKNSLMVGGDGNPSVDQQGNPTLVRRMSASSDSVRADSSDVSKNDLIDTGRSVSAPVKKKKKFRFKDLFDLTFKNVAFERMSPNNKRWLIYYKIMCVLGIAFLVLGYTFFILLLFSPIIHIDQGELVDEELFVPVTEYLLHSLVPLWKQKAYFAVVVVFIFSISLPFVKMIATVFCLHVTWRHRRKQINLFFGNAVNPEAHASFLSGESSSLSQGGSQEVGSNSMEYSLYEDGKLIKYAREILLILKLISKFQMVDVLILLLNISYLRSAFTWTRPGTGLLYLIVYCIASILGTQLLNLSVEGERDMFEYWRAVRLMCLPRLANKFNTPYHSVYDNHEVDEVNLKAFSLYHEEGDDVSQAEVNRAVGDNMHSGLNALNKFNSLNSEDKVNRKISVMHPENELAVKYISKASAVDYLSDASSELGHYELLYLDKKEIKVRWYRSEIFVSVLVLINVTCGCLIVTNEKLFGIAFSADPGKNLGIDGTQMTFFEMVSSIRDCWYVVPFFVYFFLSIILPCLFALSFMTGLVMYNFFICNKNCNSISKFDASKPLANPSHCLIFPVKVTKAIFNFCNILSEWALGDVLALGMVAGFISISTAYNVKLYIPPKKIVAVFPIIWAYGLTSLLLNVQFFMWYSRIINRLSDVTIYIESVHTTTESTNSDVPSESSLKMSKEERKKMRMVVKGEKANLPKLESYIDGAEHDIMHRPHENVHRHHKNRFKRMVFKVIDVIRHVIYSKFIKSLFFVLLFFMAVYSLIFAFVYTVKPVPVNQTKVQDFLDNGMPTVYSIVKRQMPRSFGACDYKVPPPKPCMGTDPVYTYKGLGYFELVWITGLNTINFVESKFSVVGDRMVFKLHLSFDGLRVYSKVGTCISKCTTILAGDNLCCGDDVNVVLEVSAQCSEKFPHIRDLRVESMKVKLTLARHIAQLLGEVIDLEKFIETHLVDEANKMLKIQQDVLVWRGVGYSPVDFINFLMNLNFPSGLTCNLSN